MDPRFSILRTDVTAATLDPVYNPVRYLARYTCISDIRDSRR